MFVIDHLRIDCELYVAGYRWRIEEADDFGGCDITRGRKLKELNEERLRLMTWSTSDRRGRHEGRKERR